ncbi:hypothetical protein Q7P37_010562 [Cladosporium fusiforme]
MSRRECLESLAVVEGVKLLAERAAKDEDQVGGRAEEVKVELVGEASKRRLSPGFAARATLLSRARSTAADSWREGGMEVLGIGGEAKERDGGRRQQQAAAVKIEKAPHGTAQAPQSERGRRQAEAEACGQTRSGRGRGRGSGGLLDCWAAAGGCWLRKRVGRQSTHGQSQAAASLAQTHPHAQLSQGLRTATSPGSCLRSQRPLPPMLTPRPRAQDPAAAHRAAPPPTHHRTQPADQRRASLELGWHCYAMAAMPFVLSRTSHENARMHALDRAETRLARCWQIVSLLLPIPRRATVLLCSAASPTSRFPDGARKSFLTQDVSQTPIAYSRARAHVPPKPSVMAPQLRERPAKESRNVVASQKPSCIVQGEVKIPGNRSKTWFWQSYAQLFAESQKRDT